MKHILFISSRPIVPIVGGDQIRTYQQLKYLSCKYRIDVLYLTHYDDLGIHKEQLNFVDSFFVFKRSKLKCMWNALGFLFNSLPIQVNYFFDMRAYKFIQSHIDDYDAFFCNNIRTTEYVREYSGILKCVDFVDAISMNYLKAKSHAGGLKKFIYSLDYIRLIKYERLVMDEFDRCAIISKVDKDFIENGEN